jgi:hypothetical protein
MEIWTEVSEGWADGTLGMAVGTFLEASTKMIIINTTSQISSTKIFFSYKLYCLKIFSARNR